MGRVVGHSSFPLHYYVPPPPLLVSTTMYHQHHYLSSLLWPQTLAGGWLWAGNAPALCGCCRMVFEIWGNYLCFVRQLFGRKNPRGSVDVGDCAWPQTLVGRWFELLMTSVVAMVGWDLWPRHYCCSSFRCTKFGLGWKSDQGHVFWNRLLR